MTIDKKLDGTSLTIAISGRLDTNTAPDLEDALEAPGVTAITFDLAGLEYISSAGLRVLLAAQKRLMSSGGGKVRLANPNDMVKSVLDITGCLDIFEVV